MKRIALKIAYDGTAYAGFQIQKNALSIEQVLNDSLTKLLKEEIHIIGASRTDAGVHALGNIAVFDTETRIPAEKISLAVNQYLPDDIKVQQSFEVSADFHPRYQNSRKTYEYRILNSKVQIPSLRYNTYFYHRKLDENRMQEAADYLLGEHDFAAFCSAHAQVSDTYRIIYSITVKREGSLIIVRITGNGFLYNMVRIIVGSLLRVGSKTQEPIWMKKILDSKDRAAAGDCAPALGLTLIEIKYENLPRQLLIQNDEYMYRLWMNEMSDKKKAYLTIYYCKDELLKETISRLAKKMFRYGAKYFFVRNEDNVEYLSAGSKSENEDFFMAGEYKFTYCGKMLQMDRDMRANPPALKETDLHFCSVNDDNYNEFIKIYNKNFYSLQCSVSLDEELLEDYINNENCKLYLLCVNENPVGCLILTEKEEEVEISAMCIEGKHRRKGYAKETIEKVCNIAVNLGKKRVTLQVFDKNKKAFELYISSWFYKIRTTEVWYRTCDLRRSMK